MAIYHLNVKTGSRKGGQSAKAKHDYVARKGKYSRGHDELVFLAHGNMPSWASDNPAKYWVMADLHERANGVLFRQVEFALPVELGRDEQIDLATNFADGIASAEDGELPYTLAIHSGRGHNPHVHLIMSERQYDGHDRTPDTWFKRAAPKTGLNAKPPEEGGAPKADIASRRKKWLLETRERWSAYANEALERHGSQERIDHRSYEAQGIPKLPTLHRGPHIGAMEAKGRRTQRLSKIQKCYALLKDHFSLAKSYAIKMTSRQDLLASMVEDAGTYGGVQNRHFDELDQFDSALLQLREKMLPLEQSIPAEDPRPGIRKALGRRHDVLRFLARKSNEAILSSCHYDEQAELFSQKRLLEDNQGNFRPADAFEEIEYVYPSTRPS